MAERLVAWLYDTPVAVLTPAPEFRFRLEWRQEGIERWGLGHPALSVGLPIGAPTGPRDLRGLDFFENILPPRRGSSSLTARIRWLPMKPPAFGSPPCANCRCQK